MSFGVTSPTDLTSSTIPHPSPSPPHLALPIQVLPGSGFRIPFLDAVSVYGICCVPSKARPQNRGQDSSWGLVSREEQVDNLPHPETSLSLT